MFKNLSTLLQLELESVFQLMKYATHHGQEQKIQTLFTQIFMYAFSSFFSPENYQVFKITKINKYKLIHSIILQQSLLNQGLIILRKNATKWIFVICDSVQQLWAGLAEPRRLQSLRQQEGAGYLKQFLA